MSGPGTGCVWLDGSPVTTWVTTPAGLTFEIRPPRTGSFVLPVYGPIGGATCAHWPTVESFPPRPPSATYKLPSGPNVRPRGLLNPVAKTVSTGVPCFFPCPWPGFGGGPLPADPPANTATNAAARTAAVKILLILSPPMGRSVFPPQYDVIVAPFLRCACTGLGVFRRRTRGTPRTLCGTRPRSRRTLRSAPTCRRDGWRASPAGGARP